MSSTERPASRAPGTGARVALLAVSLAAYAGAIGIAFPAGVPDRLPVLVLSILIALAAAQRWTRGAVLLAFLAPCSGLIAAWTGGTDPGAWPQIFFWAFAAGWSFRFLYDFDTRPEPSGADRMLRALLALWTLSALLAAVRARTLWALWRGLAGRVVNMQGLPEATAFRESLLTFGALASGGLWFLLLRRSGAETRRRALGAGLAGIGVSALVAILQRISILPGEGRRFWRLTGRLSGASADPNSLGLLCGLALVVGAAAWSRGGERRAAGAFAVLLFGAGLMLSGSRSGLLVAAASPLLYAVTRRTTKGVRTAGLFAGAGLVLLLVVTLVRAAPGTAAGRIASTFDSSLPFAKRVSARPILWSAAWQVFRDDPVAGAGMGVFSWELPDRLPPGVRLPFRDNPGSAYVQALAETGLVGFVLTLAFAWMAGRDAIRRLGRPGGDPAATAAAVAVLSFLAALAVGSHWIAADTGLFFFLLASISGESAAAAPALSPARSAWLPAAVGVYAIAALVSVLGTARGEEAFRFGSRIGFYPPEGSADARYQWTRRNFAVRLAPGERARLALANFSPIGAPVGLTAVDGDDRVLLRTRVDPGRSTVLDLESDRSRPSILRFVLSRSFVPRRLGIRGGDGRELGLRAVFLPR